MDAPARPRAYLISPQCVLRLAVRECSAAWIRSPSTVRTTRRNVPMTLSGQIITESEREQGAGAALVGDCEFPSLSANHNRNQINMNRHLIVLVGLLLVPQ